MWEILPELFLGDRGDARDRERLRKRGITHIVNCSRELPCLFEGDLVYLWLRMEDPDPAFAAKVPVFCRFIDEARQSGKILVHCTGAVSRSPAVILAYLCHLGGCLHKAADQLSRAVVTGIDESFLYQLGQLRGVRLTAAEVKALQEKMLGRG